MRVHAGGGERLLTWCTNIHPAETVAGIEATLDEVAGRVRERLGFDGAMGLGLWLPRGAVDELLVDARLAAFRAFLEDRRLFAFTLNAFPYRGFHEAVVKGRVFQPRWDEPERARYTADCARVLAQLLPDGMTGSISTVPLGLPAPAFDRARAIEHLHAVADGLAALEGARGRRVVLAIEAEPCAILDTVEDVARFLDEEVFQGGSDPRRRHLGACVDACHEAVMFRDPAAAFGSLRERGVAVGKVQVTAALLASPAALRDPAALSRIESFDEGRYFHQATWRAESGAVQVHDDLAPFLREVRAGGAAARAAEARVHFHVPVFAQPAAPLGTTRPHLTELLAHALAGTDVHQFEVETYTFDVIPSDERATLGAGDLASLIARELEWTRAALGAR